MIRAVGVFLAVQALCGCVSTSASARAGAPPTHAGALASLDRQLASTLARAERSPTDWSLLELAASRSMERARLTGLVDDTARAERLLERAFALAPPGAGPFLARAKLNVSVHRIDRVEADLLAVEAHPIDDPTRASIASLRAEVAMQRGDLDAAEAGYAQALALHPTIGARCGLALVAWRRGQTAVALERYAEAERMYHGASPEPVAWLHLQRGLMALDRGEWDEALAHYRDADAALPGYWLVEEHMAEIYALRGDLGEAQPRYEALVRATGNPELVDALGDVYAAQGRADDAERQHQRAHVLYEAWTGRYPEAAAGHALQHWLAHDPADAWPIAEANLRLRPDPIARARAARSLLARGEVDHAVAVLEPGLDVGWSSAELQATASEVWLAAGDVERARAAWDDALAIDPTLDR